jgi:hypothetical protein
MIKLSLWLWSGFCALTSAETVGYWRFAGSGVSLGQEMTTVRNVASPGSLDARATGGTPAYSDDVPAAEIFDPVTGATYANDWSFDASEANSRLTTDDVPELDGSFTVEFFLKVVGEPGSYETFLRRFEANDLVWKVDFDHAFNLGFGKVRSRWDTPAGAPDGIAEPGVDENVNFVVRPQSHLDQDLVYVDTGAKDVDGLDVGPQNTGRISDYRYDPASGNPSEADVALQGDGQNDRPQWHHVALSFEETSQQVTLYLNYRQVHTRTLSDSEGDGYTHPAAGLEFGKFNGSTANLLFDEIRYTSGLLTPGEFLRDASLAEDRVLGYWRLEEAEASNGSAIASALDSSGRGNDASIGNGTPLYSDDVAAPVIFDPITRESHSNGFSLDASAPNSRLQIPNNEALNTSFTVEFFMKLIGEPGGYHSFLRRREGADLRWQIDFDHAARGAYGRLRARLDTPNENNNFVVGPLGGASVPEDQRIWIDTDLGDGLVASYDDAADWSLDGDGINDQPEWHHVALTFDEESGVASFYYDYERLQTRTLSDREGNGYTHPSSLIEFGKLAASGYPVLFDELRYTGQVLPPFLFLRAAESVTPGLVITGVGVDSSTGQVTITWVSEDGQSYRVERSVDLVGWEEVGSLSAIDVTSSFEDSSAPAGASRVFYRVSRQ